MWPDPLGALNGNCPTESILLETSGGGVVPLAPSMSVIGSMSQSWSGAGKGERKM